jgi:hypothetical protein
MIESIETALKTMSKYNQDSPDRELSATGIACENDWSGSIRECVFSQEQDLCEMSLVEIMKCLGQLVRDAAINPYLEAP